MLKQLIVAIAFTVGVFVVINVIGDLAIQPQMAAQTTTMDEEPAEDMSADTAPDTAQSTSEPTAQSTPETAATPDLLPTPETPRPMPEPQATPDAMSEEASQAVDEAAQNTATAVEQTAEETADAAETAKTTVAAATGGDAESGSKLFRRKCKVCHTAEKDGRNMTGPNLWNIVGRERASIDGFRYSTPMQTLGGTWSEDAIKSFIASPRTFLPDTKMTFAGLKKESEREDVLAFLKTLQD